MMAKRRIDGWMVLLLWLMAGLATPAAAQYGQNPYGQQPYGQPPSQQQEEVIYEEEPAYRVEPEYNETPSQFPTRVDVGEGNNSQEGERAYRLQEQEYEDDTLDVEDIEQMDEILFDTID